MFLSWSLHCSTGRSITNTCTIKLCDVVKSNMCCGKNEIGVGVEESGVNVASIIILNR